MARCHTRLIAAVLVCLAGMGSAWADYPERPIRLIVPFPAGGTVDLVARLVTASMTLDLRQPFVIENRGGAGGVIATDTTAKAAADGYTLLLTTPNHTINAALNPKLPYDTEKLAASVRRAVGTAEFAERLKRDGINPVGSTAEEFAALIPREIARWRELTKSANIKLD
jgi:tripartite-type tricarboxylate transporter receptor subunit TctC